MEKKHHDIKQIIVKVLAAVSAVLMVLAVSATVIFYLLH